MAKKCVKKVDDELDKHPFYSDYGRKQFAKRIKELEQAEKELGKRRPQPNGESVQENPA
jgi:hypothetical protein